MPSSLKIPLFLLISSAILFGANIWGYALWPADEPRFAEVAREMRLTGDYLVPRVNGEVYLEKPPLLFWVMSLFSFGTGGVNEFSGRLPSVLSGILVILLTYVLARDLYGPRAGLWAAVILMTCVRFWWQARTAQIDMLLTLMMTVALLALWRWHQTRKVSWLAVLYVSIGLGLLAKGPPALVFPLLCIGAFYWKRKEDRRKLHWVLGTLFAIALVACWFIPARLAAADAAAVDVEAGIAGNLFRNTLGRFLLGVSKAQWPWYYLQSLPVDLFPWSLFLPWSLWWIWRNRKADDRMRFLLCWTVPAFIFFSISIGKRALYLLPLYPALAILLAISIISLMESDHATWRRRTGYVWCGLLFLLALAPFALPFTEYSGHFRPELAGFALVVLFMAVAALLRIRRGGGGSLHSLIGGQFMVVLLFVPWVILPVVDAFKSAAPITAPLRALSDSGQDYQLYSVGFSSEEYIFYSRKFHVPVLTSLVGIEKIAPDDLLEAARQQKAARKLISEAVEEVPIANMEAVTEAERTALRTAIETAIDGEGEEAAALRAFERDLIAEIDAFAQKFSQEQPAFMFVQDEDWRWLLPLFTKVPEYLVIEHRNVGSREVLLLGNKAAGGLAAN